MDSNRFDTLARGIAAPTSRRTALRGLAGGGLLAALGLKTAAGEVPAVAAAPAAATCTWNFVANVRLGPDTGVLLMSGAAQPGQVQGTLSLSIGPDGAIDQSQLQLADGTSLAVIGQATGRSVSLRLALAQGKTLVAVGTAEQALTACAGSADGPLEGPVPGDLGDWHMTAMGATGGTTGGVTVTTQPGAPTNPAPSAAPAPSQAPAPSSSPADDQGGGGGDTGACASGVVCNGVCCQPAPGLTPDSMVCNAGACECTYSCAAAGCGGGDGTIVNTCGSDPQPHCHSECNVPADNGCGDMTCDEGSTLDVDTCTCVPNGGGGGTDDCGGADLLHDANNCGFCGVVCGSGFCQNGVCADTDPCVQEGRTNCNGQCMDTQNDPENCGGCGIHCPSGECSEGICTHVIA